MNWKQAQLAAAMGVSKVRICQIINGRAPVTTEMALRLAVVSGNRAQSIGLGFNRHMISTERESGWRRC